MFCFVLYHHDHDWVYSARKMPVGGAAITTLHYKSDKISRYITCLLLVLFFFFYCFILTNSNKLQLSILLPIFIIGHVSQNISKYD